MSVQLLSAQSASFSSVNLIAMIFPFILMGLIITCFVLVIRAITGKNRTSSKRNISVADELYKYADLLERNMITQEEFDNIKRQLLSRISR